MTGLATPVLMSRAITVASVFSGASVLLLLVLTTVWVRNYRTVRSPLVLGLVVFGAVLLAENGLVLYCFFTMQPLYAVEPTIQRVLATIRGLQAVALLALTYSTIQ